MKDKSPFENKNQEERILKNPLSPEKQQELMNKLRKSPFPMYMGSGTEEIEDPILKGIPQEIIDIVGTDPEKYKQVPREELDRLIDIIQTYKLMNIKTPENVFKQYMQIPDWMYQMKEDLKDYIDNDK